MKNIKNYLLAIVFSILGGLTSITGYKYFNEDNNYSNFKTNENLKFANYLYDTTRYKKTFHETILHIEP